MLPALFIDTCFGKAWWWCPSVPYWQYYFHSQMWTKYWWCSDVTHIAAITGLSFFLLQGLQKFINYGILQCIDEYLSSMLSWSITLAFTYSDETLKSLWPLLAFSMCTCTHLQLLLDATSLLCACSAVLSREPGNRGNCIPRAFPVACRTAICFSLCSYILYREAVCVSTYFDSVNR